MRLSPTGVQQPRLRAARSESSVERVPLEHALALGPAVWGSLEESSALPSPFMTWAWHRSWMDAAPPAEAASSQALVLRSGDGDVSGLFPFRLFRARFRRLPVRVLGWAIGDLGCPDHLDLLASPDADIAALAPELDRLPWDAMVLDNVGASSRNVDRLTAECARRGWTVRRLPASTCPYLVLPDTWAGYLSGLSASRRQAVRHGERVLRREHRVEITDYGPERLEEGWQCLHELHVKRWNEQGHFTAPAIAQLHRRFASLLPPRGTVWLSSLDLDGKPVAAWYGFAVGDTVYFYQSGWDPSRRQRSVGNVLTGMMIQRAIERGYRVVDFLRGDEPHKRIWTNLARTCDQLVILRAGWRGAALRWVDRLATMRSWARQAYHKHLAVWFSWISGATWCLDLA